MRSWITILVILCLLLLTAATTYAPQQLKIEFELNVSQDVNVTFNGKLYQLLYQPTLQYKCLAKTYGNFTHNECYLPPKNVTLDKNTIIDITNATYIIIDRSYYLQQGNKVYQINFIQRNITSCICENVAGCKITDCVLK